MFVIDIILYIFIYFCILLQLVIMSWLLMDQLLGGNTLDTLVVDRAPGFCQSDGSFLSVERLQVRLVMFYYFRSISFQDG